MSYKNTHIELSTPQMIIPRNINSQGITTKEFFSSTNHTCSYCNGNGFFWEDSSGENFQKDCPVCQGSGMVDAMITVEWKAHQE